ncbi:MAG: metallophosphoesterase [Actinobacteria bacterium]|nr:MAG: metallophosphoesterase [Actinomycetota bacterium]
MTKIFYVTDIHGSEICWRKFLNAGPHYGADVVIVGGDITGKAMVPIVQRGTRWDTTMFDQHVSLETEDEVRDIETKILNRGYYPIRVSEEEYRHMQDDEDAVDKRFKEVMLEGTERWIAMADDRLAGKGIRAIVSPANDDMFEIDPVLKSGHLVEFGGDDPLELDGFEMLSYGWTNPTPWNTFRELPEDELGRRLEKILAKVTDPARTIFNFHAPPYGSGLDEAPALDENLNIKAGGRALRPVGSTSVRSAIERVQPVLSLHGHIHEAKGATRMGSSLVLNPGSSYEEGVLQAALITLDAKKHVVKNYQLVNG